MKLTSLSEDARLALQLLCEVGELAKCRQGLHTTLSLEIASTTGHK